MKSCRILYFLTVLLFCGAINDVFSSSDDVNTAIALSKKLNSIKMFDYSVYLIEISIKTNPNEADKLKIQLGVTYFEQNKIDEGEKIINSITSSSKYYVDSRRAMGIEAIKRGKYELGITALEDYFKVKKASPPQDEEGKDEFMEAWQYLLAAYQAKKDVKKVEEVLKYKDIIEKVEEQDKSPLSGREGKLVAIQLKLDTAEALKEEGKSGWQTIANDQLKPLDDLKWNVDSIFAIAEVEQARAYYILDRYDDALKKLTNPNTVQILSGLDDAYKQMRNAANAPSVLAAFVEGLVYRAQAQKASSDEEKIKLYTKATQKFYSIILQHSSFVKIEKVIGVFSDCKEKLEKAGKTIKIPKKVLDQLNKTISFRKKEADRLFKEEKYSQAIPIYLEELKKSKSGDQAADNLAMLSYCYVKTDKSLEAMAVASYLGEYFSKFSKTPGALLQVGEYLWNKKEYDDALVLYRSYLKACPTDQYAGAISARVAKYFYDKAADAAKVAKTLPPGEEKNAKINEARQCFVDAVPYYQNIIDNFQHTDYGRSAYYLIGLCYFNARDYLKAADAFLKFCDMESKMPKEKIQKGDIADSKLRAAESYFQFANAKEKEGKLLREKPSLLTVASGGTVPEKENLKDSTDEKNADNANDQQIPESEITKENLVGLDDSAQLNKKIEELDQAAKKYYQETIKQCEEFFNMLSSGILSGDSSPKTLTAKESASSLIAWAYDGMKEKDKAIDALSKFIKNYPKGKQTPAAMQRLGILYAELEKFEESAKVLENLANQFPESREGRQAMPMLAKSMYEIKNYQKSIEVFKKMLEQKVDLSIFDLRWALENLSDCGGSNPKDGAELALQAAKILLEKIQKPVMEDWLGKNKAAQLANDPKGQKAIIDVLREKIIFDSSKAAYFSENPKEAIKYADELLKNEKTPYFYDAKFQRALAYRAIKDYQKALADYGEIGLTANVAKALSVYYKAQIEIAETFIEQNEFKKALSSIDMIAATDIDSWLNDQRTKSMSIEERAGQMEAFGNAIYLAAFCASKLNDTDIKTKMIEKYKKYFPKGKFVSDIAKL